MTLLVVKQPVMDAAMLNLIPTLLSRKQLRRRQAIEPIIGHIKADHRMNRCHLKGETGDRLHAVLCAASYNIKWLLRMIASKGITLVRRLYFICVCARWRASGQTGKTRGMLGSLEHSPSQSSALSALAFE